MQNWTGTNFDVIIKFSLLWDLFWQKKKEFAKEVEVVLDVLSGGEEVEEEKVIMEVIFYKMIKKMI